LIEDFRYNSREREDIEGTVMEMPQNWRQTADACGTQSRDQKAFQEVLQERAIRRILIG
jgi:hypothetical protein